MVDGRVWFLLLTDAGIWWYLYYLEPSRRRNVWNWSMITNRWKLFIRNFRKMSNVKFVNKRVKWWHGGMAVWYLLCFKKHRNQKTARAVLPFHSFSILKCQGLMDSWSVGCGHELKAKHWLLTLLRTWLHQRRERLKMCLCSVFTTIFKDSRSKLLSIFFEAPNPDGAKTIRGLAWWPKSVFFDVPGTGVTGDEWLSGYTRNQTDSSFF